MRRPGPWWRILPKGWGVMTITLAARLAYVGEMVLRSSGLVLFLFIFTQLWQAVGTTVDVRAATGYTIPQLVWYLAFTEALTAAPWRRDDVDEEIRSGDVAYRLARPMAYPAFHFAADLGDWMFRFGLALLLGVGVCLLIVGPVALRPASVAAALVAALGAFSADWVWRFALTLLAFWFEDTTGIQLLYRRAVMLLGGMLIPIDAYPGWLAALAHALPFQFLMGAPARLFVAPSAAGLGGLLAAQTAYGAAGLTAMLVVYRLGLRRASAQGG